MIKFSPVDYHFYFYIRLEEKLNCLGGGDLFRRKNSIEILLFYLYKYGRVCLNEKKNFNVLQSDLYSKISLYL